MSQEFLTMNSGLAYPFREDATGLGEPSASSVSRALVVDAGVSTEFEAAAAVLHLRALSRVGDTYTARVGGSDGVGAYIDITFTAGAGRYTVARGSGTLFGAAAWVTLVFDTSELAAYSAFLPALYGDTLPLEPCVVISSGRRLKRVRIRNQGLNSAWFGGDIVLKAGTNIDFSLNGQDVTLNAVPGAGEGRVPCVESVPVTDAEMPLGGVIPDEHGDIQIGVEPGGVLSLSEFIPTSGNSLQLTLDSAARPCCTCDDYLCVCAAINKLMASLEVVRQNLINARQNYSAGTSRYATLRGKLVNVRLVVDILPGSHFNDGPYAGGTSGSPFEARIVINILNGSDHDIEMTRIQDLVIVASGGVHVRRAIASFPGCVDKPPVTRQVVAQASIGQALTALVSSDCAIARGAAATIVLSAYDNSAGNPPAEWKLMPGAFFGWKRVGHTGSGDAVRDPDDILTVSVL